MMIDILFGEGGRFRQTCWHSFLPLSRGQS